MPYGNLCLNGHQVLQNLEGAVLSLTQSTVWHMHSCHPRIPIKVLCRGAHQQHSMARKVARAGDLVGEAEQEG